MSTQDDFDDDDVLLWGGAKIGAAIGMTAAAARRNLEAGRIKCAVKRGGRWTAWRRQLRREFGLGDRRQNDGDDARVDGGA
jgi:hypothetical protein